MLGVVGALVALGVVLCLATSPPASAAAPVAQTFSYNGTGGVGPTRQYFTVPDLVESLQITLQGAGGGSGGIGSGGPPGGAGGSGSQITGTLAVFPGEVLAIDVGGAGNSAPCPANGNFAFPGISPNIPDGSVLSGYGGGAMGLATAAAGAALRQTWCYRTARRSSPLAAVVAAAAAWSPATAVERAAPAAVLPAAVAAEVGWAPGAVARVAPLPMEC